MNALEKFMAVVIIFFVIVGACRFCSEQSMTKNWGGEMDIDLLSNQKLVEVTWKDDNLWILTKEMKDDDIAEDYRFAEKDAIGFFEGTVRIHEKSSLKRSMKKSWNSGSMRKITTVAAILTATGRRSSFSMTTRTTGTSC